MSGPAAGEESLSDLQARLAALEADLYDAAARLSELEDQVHEVEHHMEEIEGRMATLEKRSEGLKKVAAKRADALYRAGGAGMVALLFGSRDLSELQDRAEFLSKVSLEDHSVFVKLFRTRAELSDLSDELALKEKELADTLADQEREAAALQAKFQAITGEYMALKRQLQAAPGPVAPAAPVIRGTGGMVCPVAGPVSFVDSWGAPRSGHTHQGVDMMAAYGTPVVAITSGTITYAAYDGSGGNMIFLSGDDGNAYWYMHNQQNLVTGGHVSAGQQIATVGDTGNAEGTPHLHFEYHPGGGAAVNPYPLVASLC